MASILEGGIVIQEQNPQNKATVEMVYFYTEKTYGEVPKNSLGMLFLRNNCQFEEGDTLSYIDGKKLSTFRVDTVVGTTRYEVTKIK